MLIAAGCGAEEKKPAEPVEFEETLGFSGEGIVERQSRVEGEIQDCMKAQGFDYVPVDPLVQQQALTGKAQTEEEFIKQFGDGVSTLFDRGLGREQTDPNDRIRKSLSVADRAAYDRVLGGENPGATFAEAVDSGDFSELGGCTKQASEAEFGGAVVVTALIGKLDELDERIVQDQRMVRAAEKWAACMTEKGFPYEEPDEIEEDLTKRFQAIVGSDVMPGATAPPGPDISYDRAALAELQREEVRIGAADLECENRELDPVERVVRPQHEAIFRRSNRRLIARVRPADG
ncbi:MAG: hypothetical protein ACRDLQ_02455 [Solirubrobacterales bacterium]